MEVLKVTKVEVTNNSNFDDRDVNGGGKGSFERFRGGAFRGD